MIRLLLPIFLLISLYGAQQIEIKAKRFEADEKKLVTKFFDHVKLTRGADVINADKAFVYFNKAKKPVKFDAIGNVTFKITHEGKRYDGRCQELIYMPMKKEYILIGDVYVHQMPDDRKIYGQKIVLDLISGNLLVEGEAKKPVKIIFKVEEKK